MGKPMAEPHITYSRLLDERRARLAGQLQRDDDERAVAEVDVADGADSLGAAGGGRLDPRERGQQGHGG